MIIRTLLLLALGAFVPGYGTELALTLMPPTGPVVPGREATVDLVAINPGASAVSFETTALMPGRFVTENGTWAVELLAPPAAASFVAAGSFAVRRYTFAMPTAAAGRGVLEVTSPGLAPLRAVLDAQAGPVPGSLTPPTPLSRLASSTRAIDAVINRTFAGRLTPNDPIYFIYGGGEDASAKFQFSFNYRLATVAWGREGREKNSHLQLGYTQRSLWDIDASSSPFYDTSYMPELSVETLATVPAKRSGWFTWIGLRTGIMHESNGRADDGSRSLNTFYVRPMFALGPLDSWHLVAFPEISGYLSGVDENENLKDYRGYGRIRMVFGKNNGPSLLFAGWAGQDFDHPTYQLDLAYPLRTKLLNFESFILLQYFDGYGESLLSYDKRSNALRFGIELIR